MREHLQISLNAPEEIYDMLLFMGSPNRFAVKCYLHLTTHGEPRRFIDTLLRYKWRYVTVAR